MAKTKAEIIALISVFQQNLYGHSRGMSSYKKLWKAELEKVLTELTQTWLERTDEQSRKRAQEASDDAKDKIETENFFITTVGLLIWVICLVKQDLFWYWPGDDFSYFYWVLIVVLAIWQFCIFPFCVYHYLEAFVRNQSKGD